MPSRPHVRQPALMDAPAKADLAFLAYHHTNPQVYAAFQREAVHLRAAGWQHFSAKAIFEHLRYQSAVRAGPTASDPYHLNNNYTSRYARLLMANDARFVGFFELRTLRTERGRAA